PYVSASYQLSTLSLHAALPTSPIAAILLAPFGALPFEIGVPALHVATIVIAIGSALWLVRVLMPPALRPLAFAVLVASPPLVQVDRKSTRLNSSHEWSSYAVFC